MKTKTDLIIEMESVNLDFGNGAGVFDITLELPAGTILALIGPSGCGKTTVMRILAGLYQPTAGHVAVFGKTPAEFGEGEKMRLGYIPQEMILDAHLTTEENLRIVGGMYGLSIQEQRERVGDLLDFVGLTAARNRLVKNLSGGMQRRLMLASALLHQPVLVFADEPTAGLDPILRAHIWENFKKLKQDGRTMVVATQFISEAVHCDQVALMRSGRILMVDSPEGLRRQAAGGEVIYLAVHPGELFRAMELIDRQAQVMKVAMADEAPGGIRVVVESASAYLPELLAALRDGAGITPQVAEPQPLPMDEVFVRLVQEKASEPERLA